MEVIGLIVLAFVILGVVLAVREWRSGRGTIVDERPIGQTEADREAIRAEDIARNHTSGWHHH